MSEMTVGRQRAKLAPGVGILETESWDSVEEQANDPLGPEFEFVTGVAGSGKTFAMKDRMRKTKGNLLCATTGIAAVNLGGATINSTLGFFDTADLHAKMLSQDLDYRLRYLRDSQKIRRIILDEGSMLDGEQLAILVKVIGDVNFPWIEKGEEDKLLRLTVVGDFAQLPPVKAKFAFEVPEWERFDANTIKLTKIRRQADLAFIEALNHARRGDGATAAEFFEPYMEQRRDDNFDGCTIVAKNDEVDRFNWARMRALPGEELKLVNQRGGRQRSEWKNIPEVLGLKVGCKVMVLANLREAVDKDNPDRKREYYYVNGDMATFLGLDQNDHPVVKLDRNGSTQTVIKTTRAYKASGDDEESKLQKKWKILTDDEVECGGKISELEREEIIERLGEARAAQFYAELEGFIDYWPLRVAYASTVHKTQGLSLDTVQIALSGNFFSNPGSVYVALSRARTLEGLRLVSTPDLMAKRCRVDERVTRFL
jgi:ATP-dependent DNA helicase PIF1